VVARDTYLGWTAKSRAPGIGDLRPAKRTEAEVAKPAVEHGNSLEAQVRAAAVKQWQANQPQSTVHTSKQTGKSQDTDRSL